METQGVIKENFHSLHQSVTQTQAKIVEQAHNYIAENTPERQGFERESERDKNVSNALTRAWDELDNNNTNQKDNDGLDF